MLKYAGQGLKEKVRIERDPQVARKAAWPKSELIQPYLADPDLIKAVNLAILLQRPLLLMGEPGCGKTRVAQAVAYELYHQSGEEGIQQDYRSWYFEWNIKSSSKAQDGLYSFDAIRRLGDAQIISAQAKAGEPIDLAKKLAKHQYIELGEIGKAFLQSRNESQRPVLLIDEIDKADIDFPNDLLNELDNGFFRITETGERISAEVKPIVFITSNAEKDLPDAFLRRCLFHYIKPFDEQMFIKIVNSRFYQLDQPDPAEELVEKAVKQFLAIRAKINDQKSVTGKSISTSELIDWFEALKFYQQLDPNEATAENSLLIKELDKAGKGTLEIPFRQVLLKNWNSLAAFEAFKK